MASLQPIGTGLFVVAWLLRRSMMFDGPDESRRQNCGPVGVGALALLATPVFAQDFAIKRIEYHSGTLSDHGSTGRCLLAPSATQTGDDACARVLGTALGPSRCIPGFACVPGAARSPFR